MRKSTQEPNLLSIYVGTHLLYSNRKGGPPPSQRGKDRCICLGQLLGRDHVFKKKRFGTIYLLFKALARLFKKKHMLEIQGSPNC
jgi:hypothetical protein